MVLLIHYPVPVGLLSDAGDLRMLFTDTIKFYILGLSVTILLLALGILAWQTYRYCTHATYTPQDAENADLLYTDQNSRTTVNTSGPPRTRQVECSTEVCRLSCRLSEALVPSSESNQTDKHVLEQARVKKVKDKAPVLWTVLQEWWTCIVKGGCNLLSGDQFSCTVQEHKDLHQINLKMEVRDFDKVPRNTVSGEVRVPIGQLNISYLLKPQEDLQIPQEVVEIESESEATCRGSGDSSVTEDLVREVLLSLRFLPTSQRLEVGLLKIRKAVTEIYSDAVMYAQISIQYNQCKLRYQKTAVVAQRLVTIFSEALMFHLPEFPLQECKILVYVYNTLMAKKPTKHLIGHLTVGREKNSEDQHWSLMRQSAGQ